MSARVTATSDGQFVVHAPVTGGCCGGRIDPILGSWTHLDEAMTLAERAHETLPGLVEGLRDLTTYDLNAAMDEANEERPSMYGEPDALDEAAQDEAERRREVRAQRRAGVRLVDVLPTCTCVCDRCAKMRIPTRARRLSRWDGHCKSCEMNSPWRMTMETNEPTGTPEILVQSNEARESYVDFCIAAAELQRVQVSLAAAQDAYRAALAAHSAHAAKDASAIATRTKPEPG